ncbi:MAG TPA: bifunctional serine/threonine-protein kinase/formylglycine-generating enzyme family protein [Thermoanaerobaculia bacterium]|nr:bifunctional serine/threonine-protein kinase/formylglycine-generating enzyme family protein [Thermoanaerobaculia bacterium]
MNRDKSDPSEEETFAPTPDRASPGVPASPAGADAPHDASGAVRYEIEGLIAEGGMGSVFLARDPALGREVALKVAKGDDPTRRARFLDEMRILGQLEHPNVVPLHSLVVNDRAPFCTMRYVRGRTLADVLGGLRGRDPETVARYSVTRLVQVLLQVTQAIDFAHSRGVLHRDLKPSNVMLGEHGEVQVLDWGLAKVMERGDGKILASGTDHTRVGEVVGTPGYMSPEQASSMPVDERSDVWALGVMMYEALTLERPFSGTNPIATLAAILRDDPKPPRERAPGREIPVALERTCLKALAKSPDARHASVRELQDEMQAWLEAEADKVKRQESAGLLALRGREILGDYRRQKAEIAAIGREVESLRGAFQPWQPVREKAPLTSAEDRLRNARARLATTGSNLVMTLAGALGHDDSHSEARAVMADYFFEQLLEAEETHDLRNVRYFGQIAAAFDDGRHAAALKGDGSLALESDPPGAEVWLYEFVEKNLRLVPENERLLGKTPLAPVPLPMGNYLVVLRARGRSDTRYPVFISRGRAWAGRVRMLTPAEIGEGFVHVPAGPYVLGGDAALTGWSLPGRIAESEDFCIGVHPVTMGEYVDFLNDLVATDPAKATLHSPKKDVGGSTYLEVDETGRFSLPPRDLLGEEMHPRRPCVSITWHSAVAYAEWRSARDGRPYRLPTEFEWEKAARGVDGRAFPWGDRFDASFCNSGESNPGRPRPLPVDSYETDVSVYGMRGAAGNARDWTATLLTLGSGDAAMVSSVIRGGAAEFAGSTEFSHMSRAAFRYVIPAFYLNPAISFRLAFTPEPVKGDDR